MFFDKKLNAAILKETIVCFFLKYQLSFSSSLLNVQLPLDVSFYKFEATLVQLFEEGKHCTEDVFISIVVVPVRRDCSVAVCRLRA